MVGHAIAAWKEVQFGGRRVGVEKSGRGRSLGVSPTCTSQLGPPAPPLLPASPPPPSLPWVVPQARELGPHASPPPQASLDWGAMAPTSPGGPGPEDKRGNVGKRLKSRQERELLLFLLVVQQITGQTAFFSSRPPPGPWRTGFKPSWRR